MERMNQNHPTTKSVTFSSLTDEEIPIPTNHSHQAELYYTSGDEQDFTREFEYGIAKCREMIRDKAMRGEELTDDELVECLGLESTLSASILRHVNQMKRAHLSAVLKEQSRQKFLGLHDAFQVAFVSDITSRAARVRSRKIASRMMRLGNN